MPGRLLALPHSDLDERRTLALICPSFLSYAARAEQNSRAVLCSRNGREILQRMFRRQNQKAALYAPKSITIRPGKPLRRSRNAVFMSVNG